MADKKLEYWHDWTIEVTDGSSALDLRKRPKAVRQKSFSDIKALIQNIKDYPEATFMDSNFGYKLAMLRQKAFKDEKAAKDLLRVCKAILGDGRRRKDQERIEELKIMIKNDIAFFKEILSSKSRNKISVEKAIEGYLTNYGRYKGSRRSKEKSNYEKVYYAYKKIYNQLKKGKLKEKEIFCFLEKAASSLDKPNAMIFAKPSGRLLTFVKTKTWYMLGPDLHISLGKR